MRYIKPIIGSTYVIAPLVLLLSLILYLTGLSKIPLFFYSFWICTAATLFILISRTSKKVFTSESNEVTKKLNWKLWLFCIFILQIALWAAYWGLCYLVGVGFNINTDQHASLFSSTIHAELLHNGLFPWTLYSVITVGMGKLAYCHDMNAYFSNLLINWRNQKEPGKRLAADTNVGARSAALFAITLLMMTMTLLFIQFFIQSGFVVQNGFKAGSLLTTVALLLLIRTKKASHYINKIFSRNIPTVVSLPSACFLLALLIVLIETMSASFVHESLRSTQIPQFITDWIKLDWRSAWEVFSFIYWISLTPLVCGFFVHISRGYTVRTVILGVMLLPVLVTLCLLISPHMHAFSEWSISIHALKIISFLSLCILLPLFLNHSHSGNVIHAYFPRQGIPKIRDEQPFFKKLIQLVVVLIYFYLVIGVNGISLFVFVSLFFFVPLLLLIVVQSVLHGR